MTITKTELDKFIDEGVIDKKIQEKIWEVDKVITNKIKKEISRFDDTDYIDTPAIIAFQELRHMINPYRSCVVEIDPNTREVLLKLINLDKENIEKEVNKVNSSLDYLIIDENWEITVESIVDAIMSEDE